MKICSICKRQYADSLKFCLEDGTVLTEAEAPPSTLADPQATLRLTARETESRLAPKRRLSPVIWVALGGLVLIAVIAVAAIVVVMQFASSPKSSVSDVRPSSTPSLSAAPPSTAAVEQEIKAVNDEIGTALLNGDPDALTRLLADEYRYVNDVGLTLNKLEVLALLRTGNLGYDELRTTDPKIEVNKEMNKADLTATAHSKGQLRRQPFTDVAFYRNTFEKREGRWQLVSETVWHRQ